MADLDPRVALLEAGIAEMRATLGRIETTTMATSTQLADLRAEVAEGRGRMTMLPTTWQIITIITGSQISLVGLMAAVVFGAVHILAGH
jgi:hypothetical protein